MLRLFLRLYLLLALGFAAAIFVVDHVIDAFYDSIVENYHRDAVRGQAYSLVEKLAPLDQAGRQRQLEDWRPHYGLELSLTDARQAKLTQEEQALLDKNLLVVREDFTEFISRIDAGPQLLDIKLPPEPSLTPLFTVLAYILLGVLVGIALVMTIGVYGLVAGIVKLDDAGLYLSKRDSGFAQGLGGAILRTAPYLMKGLSVVGMAAMFMVGGGILTHGIPVVHHAIEQAAQSVAGIATLGPLLAAITPTLLNFLFGIVAGAVVLAVVLLVKRLLPKKKKTG